MSNGSRALCTRGTNLTHRQKGNAKYRKVSQGAGRTLYHKVDDNTAMVVLTLVPQGWLTAKMHCEYRGGLNDNNL